MRLEVIADNKGAVIYVLNRPEIYIGSTETNDIVIASSEISKKHLKLIVTEEEKCYVVDQGSTNGTFLNDERLVPGRREEFVINSSLRLGDKVLLTLLGKDKGALPELPLREQFVEEKKIAVADEDKTRVISLKTLQKTKTEKVRKKRLKTLEKELKKKKQVKADKAILNRAFMAAIVVIGFAFMAMKLWDIGKKRKARRTMVAQMKETQIVIDDTIESIEEAPADTLIDPAMLLPLAEISRHTEDVNCSLSEESYFCKRMPRGSRKKNGAININNQIVIYLEQDEWLEKARRLVDFYKELNPSVARKASDSEEDGPTETAPGESLEMLQRIGLLSYLKEHLWRPLPDEVQDFNLYFVLYANNGSEMEIQRVLAIRAKILPKVTARFSEDFFKFKKYDPYLILTRLDRFYKLY